jgi:methylated-DNA-[protein]-cysteine S-methyltransferase
MPASSFDSPIGRLTVVEHDGRLASLSWRETRDAEDDTPLLRDVMAQLRAYFTKEINIFDLPLAPAATAEAQAVRDAMIAIPYGATATYGELAARTGSCSCARAVGQACGANPLPIVVPCHRVVGADGFGNYSGGRGPETKHWLLAHEGAALL